MEPQSSASASADSQQHEPTPERLLQLGMGFWASRTLLSAVELELFTHLARGPQDADPLIGALGLHPRGALDFLDALVALGVLEREGKTYRNTPDTEQFLDKSKPSYVGGLLEMAAARLYPYWGSLTEALRTGQPQNEAKQGGNPFDAIYRDAFATCTTTPCTTPNLIVPAGNRIPGTARSVTGAELTWQPVRGWRAGAELRYSSEVWVNDANTEAAPAYATVAVHTGYVFDIKGWQLQAAARIDNLFDRRYAGSVIVNESNGRYYEPAPGRSWILKLTGSYAF